MPGVQKREVLESMTKQFLERVALLFNLVSGAFFFKSMLRVAEKTKTLGRELSLCSWLLTADAERKENLDIFSAKIGFGWP